MQSCVGCENCWHLRNKNHDENPHNKNNNQKSPQNRAHNDCSESGRGCSLAGWGSGDQQHWWAKEDDSCTVLKLRPCQDHHLLESRCWHKRWESTPKDRSTRWQLNVKLHLHHLCSPHQSSPHSSHLHSPHLQDEHIKAGNLPADIQES